MYNCIFLACFTCTHTCEIIKYKITRQDISLESFDFPHRGQAGSDDVLGTAPNVLPVYNHHVRLSTNSSLVATCHYSSVDRQCCGRAEVWTEYRLQTCPGLHRDCCHR